MKYLIAALILLQGFTAIKLIQSRQEIEHNKLVITETIKQCGEAWLKDDISDSAVGADTDDKGDWQPVFS